MSSVIQERIRLGVVDILYEAAAQRNWRLATDAVQVTGMLTSRGEEIHLGVPLTFLHHGMGIVTHATGPVACQHAAGYFCCALESLRCTSVCFLVYKHLPMLSLVVLLVQFSAPNHRAPL